MEITIDKLKYPVGKYTPPAEITADVRNAWINKISEFPQQLRALAAGLDNTSLETHYRPGGWTARQVIHHLADSHMNALIRFKLALTEDNPTIKPYEEAQWALLADYSLDIALSLDMLNGIHQKWYALLQQMNETDFSRTFYHPANNRTQTLVSALGLYAWHGEHHMAHIRNCMQQA